MPRPKDIHFDFIEKIKKIKEAGINVVSEDQDEIPLETIKERIKNILGIIKEKPKKSQTMTFLIMYDITNNKVRTQIAKYLIKQGCKRIQKSVYLIKSENKNFQKIYSTLKEVNDAYENEDSIILVPINSSDVRSMKLIGKNVDVQMVVDKPNTLFF